MATATPESPPKGDAFKPYISPHDSPAELTFRAVALGAILGIIFAASSVYLALKVGMTVSASIPIAVLSITVFRAFGRATILENNIVQTTGSAGESIAAGVSFTMPALLLMGQDLELVRVLMVALLGGLLGVLMMIPLRQGLIVQEHGKLTYPEGTACADVLIVGEQGGTEAKTVFLGFGLGALYKLLNAGAHAWKEAPEWIFRTLKGGSLAAEVSPELLGVGYIIGPKTSATMMAGGVLSFLILIPMISIFGEGMTTPMFPATKLIKDMNPHEIRNAYILYIGAGAVATGGIISLVRSFPTIINAFKKGMATFLASRNKTETAVEAPLRTERDLPMSYVLGGTVALGLAIWLAPVLQIHALSAVLIIVFGFFFVTVSSRITGEIGSSSNPISGMTVATLLITCLLFLAIGWTGISYRAMALSTAAIVCIAASNGGTTSQDLKTGFLVGSTPRAQQIAITIGVITSALVIGWTLLFLNQAYTTVVPRSFPAYTATVAGDARTQAGPDHKTYKVHFMPEAVGTVPVGKYLVDDSNHIAYLVDPGIGGVVSEVDGKKVTKLDAPKARLFSMIIDGILTQKLPWGLVLIGVFLSLMMELCGVSALPFAVGAYLPIATSVPVMAGGLVRWLVDRRKAQSAEESEFAPGILLASGFIAGGSLAGVFVAGLAGAEWDKYIDLTKVLGALGENNFWALVPFALLMVVLFRVGKRTA
ncbi:MAG: oligopeptide transporter, OPT family [Candidatus Sericytochromatia bacterium]|nr:oligopeptide transporter, OPT family [Candidatus Sericytochromatia bacterium]